MFATFELEYAIEFLTHYANSIAIGFQLFGVIVVLSSQVVFLYRIRKKYADLEHAFLMIPASRFQRDIKKEEWKNLNKEQKEKELKMYQHANYLRENFIVSVIGLALTLVGLLIEWFSSILLQ